MSAAATTAFSASVEWVERSGSVEVRSVVVASGAPSASVEWAERSGSVEVGSVVVAHGWSDPVGMWLGHRGGERTVERAR